MVAVSVYGAVYTETDWRSVADAAVVAQDKELQKQAEKSVRQIVGALDDFISMAMKKIAANATVRDKANLKEILTQLETVLNMYKSVFESGDPNILDAQTEQEVTQRVQELAMHCMPLMMTFAENKSWQPADGDLEKVIRLELFSGLQKIVSQLKNNLQ